MRVLIIGGTRNLGHLLALALLESGDRVTVLNRGRTPDELPAEVERLRADRTDRVALAAALEGREFDGVVDTTLYTGPDARAVVDLLDGNVGSYVFLGTGQVYLVRSGLRPPFREDDYDGAIIEEPARATSDHDAWRYGVEKRDAEDVLAEAHASRGFPFVSLRLPMVNGERDHYERIRNYVARLDDGSPILVPEERTGPLRHVYSGDVVRAIVRVLARRDVRGISINISQPETVALEEFLMALARIAGRELRIATRPRAELERHGLLPHCSPFSGRWMSVLDNERSIDVLGMRYTPLETYLEAIVHHERGSSSPPPAGYAQRPAELALLES